MSRKTQKDNLSKLGEFGLIELIDKTCKVSSPVVCGIGDDTAVLPLSKTEYGLLTTDMLVEGVHFKKGVDAKALGHKCLAASISDIAAMGGTPKYAVVSLGANGSMNEVFVKDLYAGMQKTARRFKTSIVGGDTVKHKKTTINVALYGSVRKKNLVLRSKARVGDFIFVTGPLGASLKSGHHLEFEPRIKEAHYLRKFKPNAMIDISDGLVADLNHILKASGKGAFLFEEQIPLRDKARISNALYDGEDFELLFTVPSIRAKQLLKVKKFYCIGRIAPKKLGLRLVDKKGKEKKIKIKGYTHF